MMRRAIGFILVVAVFALAWLALPYVWLPKGTSTISLWWATETFQQCSRSTPKTDGPYWLPNAAEILALESSLWPFLQLRDKHGLPVPAKFQQYQRQYIGFTRNGERLIYGNFSPSDDDQPWRRWSLLEKPVSACDGGKNFWGIVYRPKTDEFEEPQFNGDA
jgi:hypothetical protein